MKRRSTLKTLGILGAGLSASPSFSINSFFDNNTLRKSSFGPNFLWGAATAAYQIEGAVSEDGRSPSIWDTFSHKKGKIKTGENGDIACDFYHRYEEDISLAKQLNLDVFRFSISWSRILPNGTGVVNQKGIDFYHRVIDACLDKGLQPWVTLYHWDLPQTLEDKGGWKNRDIIEWFAEYVEVCTQAFGNKVKNWMVMNEPVAFTVLGYLLGVHAPGKIGFHNVYPAIHHTAMCQSEGGRIIRRNVADANIGTTFSCSSIHPVNDKKKHGAIVKRMDALLNRLFIEPVLGMGYPTDGWKLLKNIHKYVEEGDMEKLKFDFDFIGLQNYTQTEVKRALYIPKIWGLMVQPNEDEVEITEMGWEVYPEGIYEMIKRFSNYSQIDKIIITENGAAFPDEVIEGKIHDVKRIKFYKDYLAQVLKAKNEGVNVAGYFCWSLMDNFEWAEGYKPRFGLIHVDFKTQKRSIKDSGYWFQKLLAE